MTGDPHQETRPSIFFEPYPNPGHGTPSFSNLTWEHASAYQNSYGNVYANPGFNMIAQLQSSPTNYQFCQVPSSSASGTVQFPFPAQYSPSQYSTMEPQGAFAQPQPLRCKRKIDSPDQQRRKQLITEEKMAEHMSRLHINSETKISTEETESSRTQRLYMCEEMRKLKTDSILPASLLERLTKPSTALVLWQPRNSLLPAGGGEEKTENNNEESEMCRVSNENFMDLA